MSARVGRGLTLGLALAAEEHPKINLETWKKALTAHPEFSPHYEGAKGKFLEESVNRIVADKRIASLMWLLERRHSDLFGKPEPQGPTVNVSQNMGIPADVLERARAVATAKDTDKAAGKAGDKGEGHG